MHLLCNIYQGIPMNTNFEKVDDQFLKMENTMKEILKRLKQIEDVASEGIYSLEGEVKVRSLV